MELKFGGKKAQGLSVSMIILIVLGLIIVGVIVFLVGGKVKDFGKSTNSCTEKRGECEKVADCKGPILGQLECADDKVCCQSIG